MTRLEKYYGLIGRNATVTLTNRNLDITYYEGSVKDIPSELGDSEVEDFTMNENGDILFKIKVQEVKKKDPYWQEGVVRVYDENYHYWVKVYATGSQYGIEGGRISKLTIKRCSDTVANYDRGWDIKPADEYTQIALAIIMDQYNK